MYTSKTFHKNTWICIPQLHYSEFIKKKKKKQLHYSDINIK